MVLLRKINDFLEIFCQRTAAFTLILFTIFVSANVLLRAGFSYSLSWAQDGAVMLFIWTTFLGAPAAMRRRLHFIIDLIGEKHQRIGYFFDALSDAVIYIFLYVMVIYGVQFLEIAHSVYYSYLYIPQSYIVVSIPLSGVAMFLINTENFIFDLRKCLGYEDIKEQIS